MLKGIARVSLTLIAVFAVSLTFAQDWYFGGGFSGVTEFDNDVVPMATMQAGTNLASNFGFRASVDTQFNDAMVNADVMYNIIFPESSDFGGVGYIGLGPSGNFANITEDMTFEPGLHATLGVEARQDNFGVFAELQPAVFASDLADIETYQVGACLRMGLNIHF
ncbi:MAG: hypothetical protein KC422_16010 [Trueperaceae bacterium]|nr:hypothetical protein [Trueperaceae bacterium]